MKHAQIQNVAMVNPARQQSETLVPSHQVRQPIHEDHCGVIL